MSEKHVDLLILGAGWTSTFLEPLCNERHISYAATSRPANPKPNTIPFEFNDKDEHPDKAHFTILPSAKTVLITFPINAKGASEKLVKLYKDTHQGHKPAFIQLGSTGIWGGEPGQTVTKVGWVDRHSPYSETNARAAAEAELLALSPDTPTSVLDLAGLWGGPRAVKHVIGRVAPTKEALRDKGGVHMIHGIDVSRAILALHENFEPAIGQRWMLTDTRVYDWWDLAAAWGSGQPKATEEADANERNRSQGPQARWVIELMKEAGVRALPRSVDQLGRALDSREFWDTFKLEPVMARLE